MGYFGQNNTKNGKFWSKIRGKMGNLDKIVKKWEILVKNRQKMGNFCQKQAKNGKFWTKIVKKWEIFVKNMQKMGNFC